MAPRTVLLDDIVLGRLVVGEVEVRAQHAALRVVQRRAGVGLAEI